eukprot:ANDGO_08187.mRNA.1 Uncharacterized protein F09G8.5
MTQLTDFHLRSRTRQELSAITHLNLCGHHLTDVSILVNCRRLQVLSVAVNCLDENQLMYISELTNLKELSLRANNIADIRRACHHLKKLPVLQKLWLLGNPCVEAVGGDQNYRDFVWTELPQIDMLDDRTRPLEQEGQGEDKDKRKAELVENLGRSNAVRNAADGEFKVHRVAEIRSFPNANANASASANQHDGGLKKGAGNIRYSESNVTQRVQDLNDVLRLVPKLAAEDLEVVFAAVQVQLQRAKEKGNHPLIFASPEKQLPLQQPQGTAAARAVASSPSTPERCSNRVVAIDSQNTPSKRSADRAIVGFH